MVAAVAVAAICSFQFIGTEGDPVSVLVIGDINPAEPQLEYIPFMFGGTLQHILQFFIYFQLQLISFQLQPIHGENIF